ncbi:hypothetical protein [Phaeovulum sp.]|jgi:hypothetical protein|uniref:hypothetical protein n=1 Tax=Phaeovulum sp. TaxID=2934796 RepID=UPI00272F93E0|nr:hypothetical protein [Phaeovulum sp.]MDP1669923.1 hypothetical protein [Phaeovulum sp.]MDZ4118635.1 hypothetical protein [Phaeovulum sp.]
MKSKLIAAAFALSLGMSGATAQAQTMPFGSPADADYAQLLWDVMTAAKLVGPGMIHATPYEGTDPHGMILETFYTTATINGHEGDLIVKRNYGPVGVTEDAVLRDPAGHLGAYTVMFRREAGYDADNLDWFWVKYLPDGSIDKMPDGTALAGQVAKGMADDGCIACHLAAEGDMVFTSDHLLN